MQNKINLAEQILKFFESITIFLEKYGIIKTFKTVFTCVLLYWLLVFSFKPSIIFDKWNEIKDDDHKGKIEETLQKQYTIKQNLLDLHYHSSSMRTLILGLHNGVESLYGGYQFLKLSALFEECGEYQSVMEEYQNIHLTHYPIFSYLYKNELFCGDINKLKEIDNKLYHKLVGNNVNYIHIQSLIGNNGSIVGFLVLTWEDEPKDHNSIHNNIYKKAITISRLLE